MSLGGRNWWNKLDSTPRYLCRCIDQLAKAVYDKNKRIELYWLNSEVEKRLPYLNVQLIDTKITYKER